MATNNDSCRDDGDCDGDGDDEDDETHFSIISLAKESPGEGKQACSNGIQNFSAIAGD